MKIIGTDPYQLHIATIYRACLDNTGHYPPHDKYVEYLTLIPDDVLRDFLAVGDDYWYDLPWRVANNYIETFVLHSMFAAAKVLEQR